MAREEVCVRQFRSRRSLPDGVPAGFFKDKIVVIGGQFALGGLMVGRDEFATPYSRLTHGFSPGAEVHANFF